MRFSAQTIFAVTSTILTIALFSPRIANGLAGSPEHHQQPNPFRGDQVTVDSTIGKFAVGGQSILLPPADSSRKTLTIGATIPPTEGRFVQQGRHWYFQADYPEFAVVIVPNSMRRPKPTNVFRVASARANVTQSTDDRLFTADDRATDDAVEPPNPLRWDKRNDRFAFDEHSDENYIDSFPATLAIADNLMLDRVVARIRRDQVSEGWVVSGEIIQHRGRPCLLIHAAKHCEPVIPFALN